MDTLATIPLTGRKVDGPTAELIELQPEEGPLITALQLEPDYRGMKRMGQSIQLAFGFMSFPMVTGLVELDTWLPEEGALLYPTGDSRSVAEILSTYRRAKKQVGVRAAIELCYLGGMILAEAAETGAAQGVFSHGDLSPWRVLVRPDGELQIIGYGLPSPEVLRFRDDPKKPTLADTWRYAPPERVSGAPEDASSDIVSLCLIAAEMITGDPLLDGSPEDIRKDLEKGQLPALVGKHKKAMGKAVAEVLAYAVNFDPRNRFDTPEDFVTACEGLLEGGLAGDSLAEAGQKVATTKRGKALKAVDDTAVLPISGRAIRPRGQKAVQEAIERAAQEDDRWESRGGRSRSKDTDDSKRPRRRPSEPEEEEDEAPKRPRRRSEATAEDEAPKRPRRRSEATDDAEEEASKRPRRRSAASTSDDDDDTPSKRPRRRAAASSSDDDDTASKRPRRRASATSDDDDDDSESKRPRRRSAAKTDDDSDDSTATKRPRRRAAASTADEDAADDDDSNDDADTSDTDEPKRPRRRKRRTSKK